MSISISIIIPVFNRVSLIKETLLSIQEQSFADYECLLVDDGSTDGTIDIIENFLKDDQRFKLYERPQDRQKGAPTCRNIGLEQASGKGIVFFDSDDLMTSNHLEEKWDTYTKTGAEIVITRTKRFEHPDSSNTYYYKYDLYFFDEYPINLYHYARQDINWLTYDTLIEASLAKKARFNESLQRGQEFNYHCKLLTFNPSCVPVNTYVTLRRMHPESIRGSFSDTERQQYMSLLMLKTLIDIEDTVDSKTARYLIAIILKNVTLPQFSLPLMYYVTLLRYTYRYYGIKAVLLYLLCAFSQFLLGKSNRIRKHLKKQLDE